MKNPMNRERELLDLAEEIERFDEAHDGKVKHVAEWAERLRSIASQPSPDCGKGFASHPVGLPELPAKVSGALSVLDQRIHRLERWSDGGSHARIPGPSAGEAYDLAQELKQIRAMLRTYATQAVGADVESLTTLVRLLTDAIAPFGNAHMPIEREMLGDEAYEAAMHAMAAGISYLNPPAAISEQTVDADAKDAARYRKLRGADWNQLCDLVWQSGDGIGRLSGAEFDSAIDAISEQAGVR